MRHQSHAWVLTTLLLWLCTACSDSPPGEDDASTNGGCSECPDSCDTSTGQCADDPDLGDAVEETVEDMTPDEGGDPDTIDLDGIDLDDARDVAGDPADADETTDQRQDPDIEPDQDAASDPDVESDPDEQDRVDGPFREVDPLYDVADVEDEDVFVPPVFCPFDHLEADSPNNTFETASVVSSGPVMGTVGLRGADDREALACGDLAFQDLNAFNRCTVGGCECEIITELAVCGVDDPDYHTFDVIAGDNVFVRVTFEEPFTVEDVSGALLAPPTGVTCGDVSACEDGEGCFDSDCRPIIDGAWRNTGGDAQNDTLEFAGLDSFADGDPLANYVLQVNANSEVHYSILVEVDPTGRSCLHDDWDLDWTDHTADGDSECDDDSCQLEPGDSGDDDPPTIVANICEWDGEDHFRHVVESGGGVSRRFDVIWDLASDATVIATFYPESGESEPYELKIDHLLRLEFCAGSPSALADGTHRIVVTSDEPVAVKVSAYTNTFGCAD